MRINYVLSLRRSGNEVTIQEVRHVYRTVGNVHLENEDEVRKIVSRWPLGRYIVRLQSRQNELSIVSHYGFWLKRCWTWSNSTIVLVNSRYRNVGEVAAIPGVLKAKCRLCHGDGEKCCLLYVSTCITSSGVSITFGIKVCSNSDTTNSVC
jgi:hypothetical protein